MIDGNYPKCLIFLWILTLKIANIHVFTDTTFFELKVPTRNQSNKMLKIFSSLTQNSNGDRPAVDSPENILNALNNDCVQEILRRLPIKDFLNAAQTCKRFRKNAKECFPYKSFYIFSDYRQNEKRLLPIHQVKDFLIIFGHLIKKIYWLDTSKWKSIFSGNNRNDITDAIADYCGETLIELEIINQLIEFKKDTRFNSLEYLYLKNVTVRRFALFPQLKRWDMINVSDYNALLHDTRLPIVSSAVNCIVRNNEYVNTRFSRAALFDWMRQKFPSLTIARIIHNPFLTDDVVIEFQKLNPLLTMFAVFQPKPKYVSTSVLEDIAFRLPHLKSLDFRHIKMNPNMHSVLKDVLLELKHLDTIYLPYRYIDDEEISREIVNIVAKNDVKIKHFGIHDTHKAAIDLSFLDGISKMKYVNELTLYSVSSQSNLMNIINKVPNLKKLKIFAGYNINDRFTFIEFIIENCKNLTSCEFTFYNFGIDTNVYNKILALVKDRLSMTLWTDLDKVSVNRKTLEENKKWLSLKKHHISIAQTTVSFIR